MVEGLEDKSTTHVIDQPINYTPNMATLWYIVGTYMMSFLSLKHQSLNHIPRLQMFSLMIMEAIIIKLPPLHKQLLF